MSKEKDVTSKKDEPTSKNIYQRINAVMTEVDYIQKGDKRVNNQYRYVSHDQVSAELHPYLVKHGICVVPTVTDIKQVDARTEVVVCIKFVNVDDPKDFFEVRMPGYGIDGTKKEKTDPKTGEIFVETTLGDKGPGKAISYACKYALLKTFVLETGDDPDHDQDAKVTTTSVQPAEQRYSKILSEEDSALLTNFIVDQFPDEKIREYVAEYIHEYCRINNHKVGPMVGAYKKNLPKFFTLFSEWHTKKMAK